MPAARHSCLPINQSSRRLQGPAAQQHSCCCSGSCAQFTSTARDVHAQATKASAMAGWQTTHNRAAQRVAVIWQQHNCTAFATHLQLLCLSAAGLGLSHDWQRQPAMLPTCSAPSSMLPTASPKSHWPSCGWPRLGLKGVVRQLQPQQLSCMPAVAAALYLKALGRAEMGRNSLLYSTAAAGPPTKGAVHQIQWLSHTLHTFTVMHLQGIWADEQPPSSPETWYPEVSHLRCSRPGPKPG